MLNWTEMPDIAYDNKVLELQSATNSDDDEQLAAFITNIQKEKTETIMTSVEDQVTESSPVVHMYEHGNEDLVSCHFDFEDL